MGRLIEENRVVEILQQTWLSGTIAHRFIDDIKRRIRTEVPTVEAIPKDQYEARLKADLEAILTDLYMEIEELDTPSDDSYDACIVDCERLVQQKINSLKGEIC